MIPTRVHAVLDCLSAGALILGPPLLGWRPALRRPLAAAGLATAAYSAMTRYEGGLRGRLSMREHLGLDAAQGAVFCAAALALERERRDVRLALAGYGLFALAAAALTDRNPGR